MVAVLFGELLGYEAELGGVERLEGSVREDVGHRFFTGIAGGKEKLLQKPIQIKISFIRAANMIEKMKYSVFLSSWTI